VNFSKKIFWNKVQHVHRFILVIYLVRLFTIQVKRKSKSKIFNRQIRGQPCLSFYSVYFVKIVSRHIILHLIT